MGEIVARVTAFELADKNTEYIENGVAWRRHCSFLHPTEIWVSPHSKFVMNDCLIIPDEVE